MNIKNGYLIFPKVLHSPDYHNVTFNVKEVNCTGVDWIELSQYKVHLHKR